MLRKLDNIQIDQTTIENILNTLVDEGKLTVVQSGQKEKRYYINEFIVDARVRSSDMLGALKDHYEAVSHTMQKSIDRKSFQHTADKQPVQIINASQLKSSGSTYSFDVFDGHPDKDMLLREIDDLRARLTQIRKNVQAYNEQQQENEYNKNHQRIVIYFGFHVDNI